MLKEAEAVNHPYWPRNLSIPNYVANDRSMSEILIFLFSVSGLLLLATWSLTGCKVSGSRLSGGRRLALCWFTVCGFIHGVIEGWFSLYYTIIPEDQSFLSQLCESEPYKWYKVSTSIGKCLSTIFNHAQGKNIAKETADMQCKFCTSYF